MNKLWMAALVAGAAMPFVVAAQSAAQRSAPAPVVGGASATAMSLERFQARHDRRIMAADTDGDGRVSRAEFVAAMAKGGDDPAKRFARLDRNGDGHLDKAEVDTMLAHRFRRLDIDGDGVVSLAERMSARAAHGRGERADRTS